MSQTTFNTCRRCAAALLLSLASACSHNPAPSPSASQASPTSTRHVTFVQWTDPHVFDAGKGRHAEGIREEELDNWAAFHWAVLETNRLVLTEHRVIDFVVITGDFGLENVQLIENEKRNRCPGDKPGEEGPIPMVPLERAAADIARELDALLVKRVYLVPGNNDLSCENPNDLPRWSQFVTALQKELSTRNQQRHPKAESAAQKPKGEHATQEPTPTPTAVEVVDLANIADPPVINGITLLGLDSAYFKNHEAKLKNQTPCADATVAEINPVGKQGPAASDEIDPVSKQIQEVANAAILKEMDRVSKQIQPAGSYLLFTHIPDLKDPFVPPGGSYKPSWSLPKRACEDWNRKILSQNSVLGIFAGHFHIADRTLYPHNFGYSKPDQNTAEKLWLAPPLAEKYQWRSPAEETARGILLVSVDGDGATRVTADDNEKVKASAIWFSTLDPRSPTVGDDKLAEARAAELDLEWDKAATRYHDVLALSGADAKTRATALSGYLRAREKMRSLWWQSKLTRWFYVNGTAVVFTIAIVLAVIFLYAILHSIRAIKGARILLKFVAVPGFEGCATINATVSMTQSAPVEEFAALLRAEGEEIRVRLRQEQENWAAGHITMLAPSGSSLESVVGSIPKVGSVNVSEWMKFLLNLLQLFRWTVQTGLAVIPPDQFPAPTASAAGAGESVIVPGAELNAYAVLQWAWVIRNSWWCKKPVTSDRTAMRDLARQLAELISGEAFV